MKISKRIGTALALVALGALVGVACGDSGSCQSACEHAVSCIPDGGGGSAIPPNFCADQCAQAADAGSNGDCPNTGAAYDCINGLSCADIIGSSEGPSQAYLNCIAKAGCDAGI